METPKTGRAIINEGFDDVQIVIPVKKNYFLIIMPFVGIAIFFVVLYPSYFRVFPLWKNNGEIFPVIWLAWVGFVFLMTLRGVWWNLAGREVIEAGQGTLSIKRKGDWLSRSRVYDLAEARYFRADEHPDAQFNNVFDSFGGQSKGIGTIRFEYGAKTIRFGESLSQAEGNYILQKLKDRKVLTEASFLSQP